MQKQIWLTFIASGILVVGPGRALAQTGSSEAGTVRLTTGPLLGAPGEHLLLCASDIGSTPITLTQQFLDGVTGAILSEQQITLQPPGSTLHPPDPCLEMVVPVPDISVAPTSAAPVARQLFIGVISLNPQSLSSQACLGGKHMPVTSLQVFTLGLTAAPVNIRYIPLLPPDPCLKGW
jgi:hypothetical protein